MIVLEKTVKEDRRGRTSFVKDLVLSWIDSDKRNNIDLIQNERLKRIYDDFFKYWVDDNNLTPVSYPAFINEIKSYLTANNLQNKFARNYTMKKGTAEVILVDKTENSSFKSLMKEIDWKEKFKMMEENIKLLSNGVINSMIIYGTPGSGKTHTVNDILKKEGANYITFSGGVKGTYELVKILHDYKDGYVLVFDDFDSVMKNAEQKNILKTALNDENVRTISYVDSSKKPKAVQIPDRFDFTSGIVFISNLKRFDPAIKSRSISVEIILSKEDMLDKIKENIKEFMPRIPINLKLEVLNFLIDNINNINRIDFRQFKFALAQKLAQPNSDTWKKWALIMLR